MQQYLNAEFHIVNCYMTSLMTVEKAAGRKLFAACFDHHSQANNMLII